MKAIETTMALRNIHEQLVKMQIDQIAITEDLVDFGEQLFFLLNQEFHEV